MRTPIQYLMDEFAKKADSLPDTLDANVAYLVFQECYDMAKELLEKEKEVMCEFANDYADQVIGGMLGRAEQYYKETFNIKEK